MALLTRRVRFNPTTAQVMFTPPSPLMMPRGGILADEMGLGKTISTIALIATNPPTKAYETALIDIALLTHSPLSWLQPEPPLASNAPIRSRATLVVCPLSMLNTWRDEVVRALADEPNKPRVRLFYGPQRISDPTDLANSDVVITTYSTIVSELKMHLASQPDAAAPPLGQSPPPAPRRGKGESPLFAIEWWRIALDEAHTVRCKKTQSATAVFKLRKLPDAHTDTQSHAHTDMHARAYRHAPHACDTCVADLSRRGVLALVSDGHPHTQLAR